MEIPDTMQVSAKDIYALKSCRYIIVSPVCNESEHFRGTIDSVLQQTIIPALWLIVDDGSVDNTWEIIRATTSSIPWIRAVRRSPKGYVGLDDGEDLSAIHEGLKSIRGIEFEYLAKLDGDVTLEPMYFESLLRECQLDPAIGIISGSCWELINKGYDMRRAIRGSAWAAARLYRRACFESLVELEPILGWDMLHVLRARTKSWKVKMFSETRFFHHRKMGSRGGILKGNARYGRTSYLLGYSRLYFTARLIFQLTRYPYLLGSVAMVFGYLAALVGRETLVVSEADKNELHRMQSRALAGLLRREDHRR